MGLALGVTFLVHLLLAIMLATAGGTGDAAAIRYPEIGRAHV